MSRQAWRYQTLPQNTAKINRFCRQYGFKVKSLNNGYQLRIEDVLDLYPVRAKFHNLTTHERGEWDTMDDLRKIMLKALPTTKVHIVPETYNLPEADTYKVKQQPKGYVGKLYGVDVIGVPRWRMLLTPWKYNKVAKGIWVKK